MQSVKFRRNVPIKDRHIANVFGFRRKGTFTDKFDPLNKGISLGASNLQHQHNHRKDWKSSKLSNPKHKSGCRGSIRSEAPITITPEIQTKKMPQSNFARQPSWSNLIGNEQLTICQETVRETDDKGNLSGHSEDIEAIIVRDINRHGPS